MTQGDLGAASAARLRQSADNLALRRARALLWGNPAFAAGILLLFLLLIGAICGQVAPPYDPIAQDFSNRQRPPSLAHLLGTDQFGRDILSRLLAGAGPMLAISVGATALACLAGIAFGILSSTLGTGGKLLSRLLDGFQAFPSLLLSILLVVVVGATYSAVVIAIALAFFPLVARVTEAVIAIEGSRDYVQAAHALGMRRSRILVVHILPNGSSALLVQATTILSLAVLVEASLSFLGLGPQSMTPTWGRMVFDARATMELAPHTVLAPLAAISLYVIAVNVVGDGLRDALDPVVAALG